MGGNLAAVLRPAGGGRCRAAAGGARVPSGGKDRGEGLWAVVASFSNGSVRTLRISEEIFLYPS